MTAAGLPAPARWAGMLLAPWRGGRVARGVAHAAGDVVAAPLVGAGVGLLMALSLASAVTFVVALPLLAFTFTIVIRLGRVERHRAAALLDLDLPDPHPRPAAGTWLDRMRQRLRSPSHWREVAYLVLGLPALGVLGLAVLALWATAAMATAVIAGIWSVYGHSAGVGPVVVHGVAGAVAALAAGLFGLAVVAPWATVGVTTVDRAVARRLLGPGGSDLTRRLVEAEAGREAAVDQAEAERRRIERDLHDGVQQRLVALAMDLGRARERLDRDPAGAGALVARAHEDAKATLAELRDLARGIHPAVLTDRGLDAALSAVVARCPVPVDLAVDLPGRLPATIESAAYFVVAEALTNVAKHAHASRVRVAVATDGRRLVVDVTDDGVGGAATGGAGGLAGLHERVAAIGGRLAVLSPAGGPTSILVDLPCGS